MAAVAATGMSVALLIRSRWEYDHLRKALARGQFQVVEGRVTDFVPEHADGHPREAFRVGNAFFNYSSSDITSAFHKTAAKGGPIRQNLVVRIAANNGSILRLEVANDR